jgi:crossover junction endonuclease MUS81
MNYIIKFDNREKELIKLLEFKDYNFILENLDIGDIQLVDPDSNEIIFIIERKTISDLSASIKDGRYKEQKERMIHSLKKSCRKIILIEGSNMDNFGLPLSTFNSVIINTMLRDNMHIHMTKNINDTIEFIENIIIQLPKYYEDLKKEIVLGEDKEYTAQYNCSTGKKENITSSICFRNMLAQIPGISTSMANVYVEKYKNMEIFIETLSKLSNKNKNELILLLANEKYGISNRKIGNKIAEKIFNNIFNEENYSLEIIKKIKIKKTKISILDS